MRESINGYGIFNANKMKRPYDARPVLIVESDADQSIINHHLRSKYARSTPGFSKSATLLAAELHLKAGDDWAVAIVDRDLDGIDHSNVFTTAYYDLEAELFFLDSQLVRRTIYSHVVSENFDAEEASQRADVVFSSTITLATTIGVMRKHAHESKLGVSLAALPIHEIVRRSADPDTDYASAAAQMAAQKSGKPEAEKHLKLASTRALDDEQTHAALCNGHDLFMALCAFIGQESGRRPSARDVARGMHAAIACTSFRRFSIFDPLNSWLRDLTGDQLWDCA